LVSTVEREDFYAYSVPRDDLGRPGGKLGDEVVDGAVWAIDGTPVARLRPARAQLDDVRARGSYGRRVRFQMRASGQQVGERAQHRSGFGDVGGPFGLVLPTSPRLNPGQTWALAMGTWNPGGLHLSPPLTLTLTYRLRGIARVGTTDCLDVEIDGQGGIRPRTAFRCSQGGAGLSGTYDRLKLVVRGRVYMDIASGRTLMTKLTVFCDSAGTVSVGGATLPFGFSGQMDAKALRALPLEAPPRAGTQWYPGRGHRVGDVATNPLDGAQLVWVPAGRLARGDPDAGRPERSVQVPGFWVYRTEVTNAQYRQFCRATGRAVPRGAGRDDEPVVNVSWHEAAAYSNWAHVDLPAEAEWERAARGDDGRAYPWGNRWDGRMCRNRSTLGSELHAGPVGAHVSDTSAWGAKDLAGNVSEWCADWDGQDRLTANPSSPWGPARGEARVTKGGSWWDEDPADFRASQVRAVPPGAERDTVGFRCVTRPGPPGARAAAKRGRPSQGRPEAGRRKLGSSA